MATVSNGLLADSSGTMASRRVGRDLVQGTRGGPNKEYYSTTPDNMPNEASTTNSQSPMQHTQQPQVHRSPLNSPNHTLLPHTPIIHNISTLTNKNRNKNDQISHSQNSHNLSAHNSSPQISTINIKNFNFNTATTTSSPSPVPTKTVPQYSSTQTPTDFSWRLKITVTDVPSSHSSSNEFQPDSSHQHNSPNSPQTHNSTKSKRVTATVYQATSIGELIRHIVNTLTSPPHSNSQSHPWEDYEFWSQKRNIWLDKHHWVLKKYRALGNWNKKRRNEFHFYHPGGNIRGYRDTLKKG